MWDTNATNMWFVYFQENGNGILEAEPVLKSFLEEDQVFFQKHVLDDVIQIIYLQQDQNSG